MTDPNPRKNVKKNDKENKPFADSSAPNQPQSSPAPASGGLVERPAHTQNLPQPARPSTQTDSLGRLGATTTLGDESGRFTKPHQPTQGELKSQADPVDQQTEVVEYEQPEDGSRIQLVKLSSSDPEYEEPMDISIPSHWVTWKRTEWPGDNDFGKAVCAIEHEYYQLRMQMSPIVGGGVIAYQVLNPGTDELSEPYLEVQLCEDEMDRWSEVLPVIKKLIAKHIHPDFQHVLIRFNFPRGVGFSGPQATPPATKVKPAKTYTPVLRQKHQPGADASLDTPKSIREHYGSGKRPKTTAERSEYVVWREDKSCNIGKTTAVGMSIGVQDGRIIDPQFGSGSCGPKFKVKNLTTGKFETYEDGTDAYFVTSAHHVLHPKHDRQPAAPDQMGFRPDGKLVITHPTRRDWEATVFSRQDRDATYAEELQSTGLGAGMRKKITKIKEDDLKYHKENDNCVRVILLVVLEIIFLDLKYHKENDPHAIVIGEMFLTTGQTGTSYTNEEVGPLLDNSGDLYLNDLSVIKLRKEIADDFDNIFPSNVPIPRAFAADFDLFRANPVITGMKDFDPKEDDLLIKVSRTTGIALGTPDAARKSHFVCASDSTMPRTRDYCVYSIQAGVAFGHFGDSGAGLYNKYGKLVAFLLAGDDKDNVETPIYIMPVQLAQAELRRMGYELHICAPGTKAEASAAEKAKAKKTIGKKEGRQALEAQSKKHWQAEKKREAEEQQIGEQAAPDATGCVVIDHGINGNGPEKKFQVRLPDGTKKWFRRSMLGLSWQPMITNFCGKVGITDETGHEIGAKVSKLSLKAEGNGKKEKGKEKKK